MKTKFFSKLSIKLILVISGILLINLAIYTIYTITHLKEDLLDAAFQNAYNISDLLKKSVRYSMSLNRKEDVYHIIRTIGKEKGVAAVRIYNKQGQISYSADSSEINKTINMNDEACNVCHSKESLPSYLPWKQMTRVYVTNDGEKVMGLINPIKNEEDCYTASCHAHHPDKNVLGVLDIILSTKKYDEIVEENTTNIITNSVFITILISIFSGLFITMIVNKPLKKISKGIEEISEGNLDYRIFLSAKDELGIMAFQFNQMSKKLDEAYKEIKEWSETLNQKVEEKNEELKKIYEQIIQIEKLASLGKLSATVAHELNNPLEGILTYSKLISKKISKIEIAGDKESLLKYLKLITDETGRCGKIVKDLLLFSHQEEGKFLSFDIIEIIEKSLSLINHHFEINRIKLIRNFQFEHFYLLCDSQKIEQALIAILINAIESMSESGNLIVQLTEENNSACIRIIDSGKGISEKDLPYIFEPFYSTKDSAKGTGLGLAVAYGIINQHKGEIIVEQTSPLGTTFKISLPRNKKEEN